MSETIDLKTFGVDELLALSDTWPGLHIALSHLTDAVRRAFVANRTCSEIDYRLNNVFGDTPGYDMLDLEKFHNETKDFEDFWGRNGSVDGCVSWYVNNALIIVLDDIHARFEGDPDASDDDIKRDLIRQIEGHTTSYNDDYIDMKHALESVDGLLDEAKETFLSAMRQCRELLAEWSAS